MGTLVLCLVRKFSNRHSFGFLTEGVQNQSRFLDRSPVSKKRQGHRRMAFSICGSFCILTQVLAWVC